VPQIRQEWVQNGFLLGAGPNPYSSIPLPAGIKDSEWDVFHKLVFNDEMNRIVPAGVMAGLSGGSAIGVPPIMNFGTQKQKDEWVRPVYEGKASFVLGSTEPSGGSDVANLRTTARKTKDGKFYVVNGVKKWITGGN
jgi:alkylation response protein AidB-like acyl-CoA dehydrogenase